MRYFLLICFLLSSFHLSAETKILALAGSTRADSYNKKLVQEAAEIARKKGAIVTVIDLKDFKMPFYDEDLEKAEGMPLAAKQFRQLMIDNQAIIIASPEYNGSLSAVLKNALDWASRNEAGKPSRDAFTGKRFALMSASPGQTGGSTGLVHLKAIIERIGGEVVSKQTSIPRAYEAFTPEGHLINSQQIEAIKQEIDQLL